MSRPEAPKRISIGTVEGWITSWGSEARLDGKGWRFFVGVSPTPGTVGMQSFKVEVPQVVADEAARHATRGGRKLRIYLEVDDE